ncbi:hypothetical protein [Pleomorphomonas sp. PLEO]|uniref:hypothetical protein n=1 Tax=Pleomorphomonas sp. PLEO TaxID=3239306 RepID=UPI00351F2086
MATVRVLFPYGERYIPAHADRRHGATLGHYAPDPIDGWEILETVLGWIAMRKEL